MHLTWYVEVIFRIDNFNYNGEFINEVNYTKVPPCVLLIMATVVMSSAYTMMSLASRPLVIECAFAFAGFGYGMTPTVLIVVTAEMYGVLHLGANFGLVTIYFFPIILRPTGLKKFHSSYSLD